MEKSDIIRKMWTCEACNKNVVLSILINSHEVYKVCSNCLIYLVNLMLSPEQYKNLIENGHSKDAYLLHDDFYTEDGDAIQPRF